MPRAIHRTAVLTLHDPTRHARAALDQAFRAYTAAYTACLHACARQYDAPTLLRLATSMRDPMRGTPRPSAPTLSPRLFSATTAPAAARVYAAAAAPLESRLRQSLREHVAQTLVSYVKLHQAWAQHGAAQSARADEEETGDAAGEAPAAAPPPSRHRASGTGRAPRFPSRLRVSDLTPTMRAALEELTTLADNRPRERELIAQFQRTRQAETVSIPFVGVAATYGCGLYLNRETNRFYARLDIVGASSHLGRPITARGRYVDLKTGVVTVSKGSEDQRALPEAATFGRGRKSLLVPLELGRWHEEAQRWSLTPGTPGAADASGAPDAPARPVAYLPQRGGDPRLLLAATPVSARLVRRVDPKRVGGYRYELHVSFRMPAPEPEPKTAQAADARPLLAINRGMSHLYAAVVTDPDASRALEVQVASGEELQARQQAHAAARQARQQHGVAGEQALEARRSPARDRRQRRIGDQHCALAANQIVALARRYGAQVVIEDFRDFTHRNVRRIPRPLRPILGGRQFEKLAQRIAERLEVAGLPRACQVSAFYISRDCPRCGARQDTRAVARSVREFVCARCGETQDRDVSAAANLARRLVWKRLVEEEQQTGVAREQQTSWEAFAEKHPATGLYSPVDATTRE